MPDACPITGTAEVVRTIHLDRPDDLRWERADSETHVTVELLKGTDDVGRAFLAAMYELGEECPYQPGVRHARRRPDDTGQLHATSRGEGMIESSGHGEGIGPVTEPGCTSWYFDAGRMLLCSRPAGHDGGHAVVDPDEDPYATWDPGKATDDPDGLPDRVIVPLVETLRARGIVTLQSCIGHAYRGEETAGYDGTLWVRADSVDGAHIRLFLLGEPFARVQLVNWPEHRWEFSWEPEHSEAAIDALRGLLPAMADSASEAAGTTLTVADGPKMIRETLCVAQAAIGQLHTGHDRVREHIARLGRLIDGCDRHRPIGPDGKHGERHTPTCGCEPDEPAAEPAGGRGRSGCQDTD